LSIDSKFPKFGNFQKYRYGGILMTATQLDERTEYKFTIPSLTKDRQLIPQERVDCYKAALEARSYQLNDGFTLIPNCKGGYRSQEGEILYEDVSLLMTHGKMPLSENELEYFADYLAQECLYVVEAGERKAYLHEGKPQYVGDAFQYSNEDGSTIEYVLEHDDDGNRCVQMTIFGNDGNIEGASILNEHEVDALISSGNEALANICNAYAG
jgi:hypothetical protein